MIAGVSGLLAAAILFFLIVRLNRLINDKKSQRDSTGEIQVRTTTLRAPVTDGLSVYLDAADVRAIATFNGTEYLATSGGLIALADGGSVKHQYTTLDGLPENDLTSLQVFRERLYIGTTSHGLVAFDGSIFIGYTFVKPKADYVNVLAATNSELLIGTLDRGLFEFDGQKFTRRYSSTTGADFVRVTELLPMDSRLYIGTQDTGLYVWREGHIEHIGSGDGLPSPHVTGLAPLSGAFAPFGTIAVATDFGVVGLNNRNELKPITNKPNITSIVWAGGRLWAGLFSGGVIDLRQSIEQPRGGALRPVNETGTPDVTGLPGGVAATISATSGRLWALTRQGAFFRDQDSSGPAFEPVASSSYKTRLLSEGHVTGLAFDGEGRLWVGYFDKGIDALALESGEKLAHIQDDRVREVNFLKYDPRDNRILAATSRGLIVFDSHLKQTVITRESDGLINNSVEHVSLTENTGAAPAAAGSSGTSFSPNQILVLPTAGGLTEIADGRARSITAFHGLASNHLYASAADGSRLFVGTLAGLVELEGLRVLRTYNVSNSHLSNNWITALQVVDGTLYIGTNGGGVDALLPTGEWVQFADDLGRFEVNQNAIHYDGERLYIGTTKQGLLVYNTRGRRWTRFNSGIPSQSVTAITSDDKYVYAGTLNGLIRIEKRVLQ